MHINELELLALFYGLKSFITIKNINILCRVDNSTAIAYINRFGGCRSTKLQKIYGNGVKIMIIGFLLHT